MSRFRPKKSIMGMTLIEVLMASAIFALTSTAVIAGLSYVQKGQRRVRALSREDRMIAGIMANIRGNLHLYQSALIPSDDMENGDLRTNALLNVDTLPIAFSDSVFVKSEECSGCPGRLGFVLQPIPNIPNMFKVTLRITHKELYGSQPRDFRFVSSFK